MPPAKKPRANLTRDDLLGLFGQIALMVRFEERLLAESQAGNLRGSLHLARGQEALPAGACKALRQTDYLTMTYRGHGYALAKGVDLNRVAAEILGRRDGLCGGQGGKMHLFDPSHGLLGANGIVAGGIPTAVGAAWSSAHQGLGNVALTVFGDGAVNQGVAMECFNLAAVMKLPVIFLCENNLYAEMTPLSRSTAEEDLAKRFASFGMRTATFDGNDVLEVYDQVAQAAAGCRAGDGPYFLQAMTYRTCGHYQLDPGVGYRTKEEVAKWEAASPTKRFGDWLVQEKLTDKKGLAQLDAQAKATVDSAFEFALASPEPAVDRILAGVFV
ncbi:MAG: thiamine pyrophosphate-dependent dehydrogenase E1 component subunit alpha [Fimbriimonadaceae bacterium]|nr:thiamine pyrophosphate-dependent dehydrogenase E1 component subunit alpha [Fimbriimonadaceae bacterium]